jgi:hypothetical protein
VPSADKNSSILSFSKASDVKDRMNSKKDLRGTALKSKKRVKRVLRVVVVGK